MAVRTEAQLEAKIAADLASGMQMPASNLRGVLGDMVDTLITTIHVGSGHPNNSVGKDGELYFEIGTGLPTPIVSIWHKENTAWNERAIPGISHGTAAPVDGNGKDGDIYLRQTAGGELVSISYSHSAAWHTVALPTVAGATITVSTADPTGGASGDLHIKITAAAKVTSLHLRGAANWTSYAIEGSGASISSGTAAPPQGSGFEGDLYIKVDDDGEIVSFHRKGNVLWATLTLPSGGDGEANVQADWDETDAGSDAFIANKPTLPVKSGNANADAVDETDTAISTSLADPSALNDTAFATTRKVARILERVLKTASTTLRGIVLLARDEDVAATETDLTRVPTLASAKALIARLRPSNRQLPTLPATGSRDNKIPKFNGDALGWEEDGGDGGDGASLSDATPEALGTAAAGSGTEASRADHVHPEMLGSRIKALYEGESDTNAFTDADHTKLDGLAGVKTIGARLHLLSTGELVAAEAPHPFGGVTRIGMGSQHAATTGEAIKTAPGAGEWDIVQSNSTDNGQGGGTVVSQLNDFDDLIATNPGFSGASGVYIRLSLADSSGRDWRPYWEEWLAAQGTGVAFPMVLFQTHQSFVLALVHFRGNDVTDGVLDRGCILLRILKIEQFGTDVPSGAGDQWFGTNGLQFYFDRPTAILPVLPKSGAFERHYHLTVRATGGGGPAWEETDADTQTYLNIRGGLSPDITPEAAEITIAGVNGEFALAAFTARHIIVSQPAAETPDVSEIYLSDDPLVNRFADFTKHSAVVSLTVDGTAADYDVWVLTNPATKADALSVRAA